MADPDEGLVLAAANGCSQARNAVARRYLPIIRAWVRTSFLPPSEAEDVVQMTMIAMIKGLGRWQAQGFWRAYVYRIAQRHIRKAQEQTRELQKNWMASEVVATTMDSDIRLELKQVIAAMGQLPGHQLRALVLAGQGDTTQELAQECRCNVNTVRSRLARARASLREHCERQSS